MCWTIENLSPTSCLFCLSLALTSNEPSPATKPEIQLGSIFLNSAKSTKCKGLSKISMFFISSVVLAKPLFKADFKDKIFNKPSWVKCSLFSINTKI